MKGIDFQDVKYAGALAFAVHIVILFALLPVSPLPLSPHLVAFFVTDVALMAVNLIAPVSAVRKRLRWHDPLVWLFLLLLAMSCSVLVSVVIDPDYAQEYLAWGSDVFARCSQSEFVDRLTEAQAIMLCFNTVVLWVNRSALKGTSAIQADPRVALSILPASFLFVAGGVFGFMTIWRLGDFGDTFTTTMGFLDEDLVSGGNGRYGHLQSLGTAAFPLFLGCAIMAFSGRNESRKRLLTKIVAPLALCAALPTLINGSRSLALWGVVATYCQLRHFGVRIGRRVVALCICFAIGMVLFLTVTRKNGLAEGSFSGSLRNFGVTAEDQFINRGGTALAFTFDLDRVGTIAMVVEYLRGGKEYLYGESLASAVSGVIATAVWITTRSVPEWTLVPKTCTEHLSAWRKVSGNQSEAPPSYAGDLFMQAGWIGLLPLSLLFGIIFKLVRTRLFTANTILGRFAWCYIGFCIVFYSLGETTRAFWEIVLHLGPVLVLCWASQVAFGGTSMAGMVSNGRETASYKLPKRTAPL